MAISNRERIARGLDLLKEGVGPFVERELRERLGGYWIEKLSERGINLEHRGDKVRWDTQGLLKAMISYWNEVFARTLGAFERSLTHEIKDVRNRWAHEEPFSSDDTYRALDSMQRLLRAISAEAQARKVERLRLELQRTIYAEQARSKVRYAAPVEGKPRAGLKPWREVVTPHPDVASGRYLQAEFAADLAQVHRGEGSDEYRDPVEFFRRTFITSGLHDLLVGALERLTGKGGDPVVELQTNFGGGKTHSMLALYHLFGEAPSADLPGVEPVLEAAGVERAPRVRRAVLVGTALSPGEVEVKPDGTQVHTLWGEMAWQLGGPEGYALVKDSDRRGTSPGSKVLADLFRQYSPCLVLIDEWVAFARQTVGKRDLPAGDFEAQATFAQALTEAAKAADRTLVVASVPTSRIEIGGEHGDYALETLKNVFERVGKPWRPASADEGFEIVRRRLFEPLTDKDAFAARDAVVDAFARMYRESSGDFPSGCAERDYRRKLENAYPIHPELFDRLYGEWSTLDKFQRTRGVLRLLAKVVHRLWENQDSSLLIMPASVPMDDPAVKSELTRYLEDVWEPIISEDVDGPNSLPLELDRTTPTLGRYSAARRVARTLYIGTAPGSQSKNPGIDDRRVRLGCTQPGESAAIFGDALRRLSDRAKHIHQDGNRYWVSTRANLNRLAEDRAVDLLRQPETIHEEIVRRLRAERERGDFAGVHICPESSGDVPDEREARLVVLPPSVSHRRGQQDSAAMKASREILEARGNSPRLYRNTLVFLAADKQRLDELFQAVAQYLSWKSICEEEEALNLDAFQRRQATTKRESHNETVDLRIREAWVHALIPLQSAPGAEVIWEEIRVTGNHTLAKRTASKLKREEMLLPVMGGVRLRMELDRYLWRDRDHVSIGELADYFARYLYLPRIVGLKTLLDAVKDAADQLIVEDTFAVASGYDEKSNRYLDLRLGGGAPNIIDNSTLLVKPNVARRQQKADEEQRKLLSSSFQESPEIISSASESISEGTLGKTDGPKYTAESTPDRPNPPTLFLGSVRINPQRVGWDAGRIAEEVIQHLSTLPGAKAEISLEIRIEIPGGVQDDIVRTVTENCTTLKFTSFGFEKE